MQELGELMAALEYGSGCHICLHDLCGLTAVSPFRVSTAQTIHIGEVCRQAKQTDRGLKLCLICRRRSIDKALRSRTLYSGRCPLGLTEIVLPVLYGDRVPAIVYVGGLVEQPEQTAAYIRRTARLTGAGEAALLQAAAALRPCGSLAPYESLARAAAAYIGLLLETAGLPKAPACHWLVSRMEEAAEQYYERDITVADIAALYRFNAKYAGQLFKRETGRSFSDCLNQVRIRHARRLLREFPAAAIIDIALQVGYRNVGYFNRVFRRSTGLTPTAYRAQP